MKKKSSPGWEGCTRSRTTCGTWHSSVLGPTGDVRNTQIQTRGRRKYDSTPRSAHMCEIDPRMLLPPLRIVTRKDQCLPDMNRISLRGPHREYSRSSRLMATPCPDMCAELCKIGGWVMANHHYYTYCCSSVVF